jgi:two-component system phosphate regulon sensor histidine kinase PhoR
MPPRSAHSTGWLSATFAATLILVAPTVALLVVLQGVDRISWLHIAIGLSVVVVILGWLVRRHLRDLAAIIAYADDLATKQSAATPHLKGGVLAEEMLASVRRLERAWQGRAEALRNSIAVNETLLDSLPDPIILLDAERHVLFSNAAVRQQFGASGVGADLAGLVRDPRVLEGTTEVLAGGEGREVSLEIVDPAERHYAVRIEPLHHPPPAVTAAGAASAPSAGAAAGACVIAMIDLTAMKRIDAMRSDFIANASHELRTPLTSLIGFIETLRGPARDDAKAREQFLDVMHQQAQRMARLVRDLLSLSMIEMSEHTPPSGEVDLGILLQSLADGLQVQARARGITVEMAIADGLPRVVGEADQLTQLFQNLIDNAIKYGAAGKPVMVQARAATMPTGPGAAAAGVAGGEPAVCVSVADRGEGIAKEHLPRLTERFYRVDAARSRAVGGTGLGLAIVKHITNRHRGLIRIESELGQGTTVTIYLPVGHESAPEGQP